MSQGTIHRLPTDIRHALASNPKSRAVWETLTPLARNEWICWVISVKRDVTRKEHIDRLLEDLRKGKRRPCCWIGCVHRKDKKISPSVKSVLARAPRKKS